MINSIYLHKNTSGYVFLLGKVLIDTNGNKYEIDLFDQSEILNDYIPVNSINIGLLYDKLSTVFDKNTGLKYQWLRIGKILNSKVITDKSISPTCLIRNIFELENKKTKEKELSKIIITNTKGIDITIPAENIENNIYEVIDSELEKIDFILYMIDTFDLSELNLNDYKK